MVRKEIDRTLDEFARACREQGYEQRAPAGCCDKNRLEQLVEYAGYLKNKLHAQIDQIAAEAVQAGVER